MLKKYSLKTLQLALNKGLNLDEQMPQKLKPLSGKALEVIVTPLQVNFYIVFNEKEIQLLDDYPGHVDTIIHSNPIGLIRLSLLPTSKARSLFNDKIRLSGDIELGQGVKTLFDELDIDWEGHLAQFTGDIVAHQIGSFVRKGLALKNQLTDSAQQNITEYLQEELRVCPTENEIEYFFKDIDELSLRVERLQAHINQLIKHHETD